MRARPFPPVYVVAISTWHAVFQGLAHAAEPQHQSLKFVCAHMQVNACMHACVQAPHQSLKFVCAHMQVNFVVIRAHRAMFHGLAYAAEPAATPLKAVYAALLDNDLTELSIEYKAMLYGGEVGVYRITATGLFSNMWAV